MKAQELRVGNLINYGWVDKNGNCRSVISVFGIIGSEVILDSNRMPDYETVSIGEIKPIPLTEEWLLKFGFDCVHEKNKHFAITDPNGIGINSKISIFKSLNDIWQIAFSEYLGRYKDYIPTTKIKYVHSLQNLFHSLTGKELELKNT